MRERTGTLRRPRLFADRRFRVPDLGSGVWILPAQINQFGILRRSLAAAESALIDGAASRSCARHSKRSSGSVSLRRAAIIQRQRLKRLSFRFTQIAEDKAVSLDDLAGLNVDG